MTASPPLTPAETRALNAAFAIAYPLSHAGHAFDLDKPYGHHDWTLMRLFHEFMVTPPEAEDVMARCKAAAEAIKTNRARIREEAEAEASYQLNGGSKKEKRAAATASILASLGDLSI